jgi:hypothetical protein
MKIKILLLLATLVAAVTAPAQPFIVPSNPPPSITLGWFSSPYPGGAYSIYQGASPMQYTNKISAGTNLTLTVTNLVRGSTNFFNITVTEPNGLESLLVATNEITYVTPQLPASPSYKPIVVLTAMFSPTLLNPSWSPVGTLPLLADQQSGFYKTSLSLPK